jgi:hypothetical protein
MNTTLRRSDPLEVFSGVLLTMGMHVLAIIIGIFIILGSNAVSRWGGWAHTLSSPITYFSMLALLLLGLTQFIYIVPLFAWLQEQQKIGQKTGVMIGAMLTVLLNGGYFFWLGMLLR